MENTKSYKIRPDYYCYLWEICEDGCGTGVDRNDLLTYDVPKELLLKLDAWSAVWEDEFMRSDLLGTEEGWKQFIQLPLYINWWEEGCRLTNEVNKFTNPFGVGVEYCAESPSLI